MTRDLARLAAVQLATALLLAGAIALFVPRPAMVAALAGVATALAAMLIGFGPLRMFLRRGPDGIVAGWIAAMMVRMAAALIGLIVLIRRFGLEPGPTVLGVCGAYVALLVVEAIGLANQIGRAFDNREATASGATTRPDELGEQ